MLGASGFVINSVKYGDSSIITKVFTLEHGLISIITNRSRKKNAIRSFSPLSNISFSYYNSKKSDIYRVKDVSFNLSPHEGESNIVELSIKFFIAEFLTKAIKEEEQNLALYSFVEKEIYSLNTGNFNQSQFHILFLLNFCEQIGIYPEINQEDLYIDYREGCSSSDKPPHDDFGDTEILSLIIKLSQGEYLIKIDRKKALNALLKYYSIQLGNNLNNLKSKAILEEVFS